jgi:Cys-tRNA(Pro) deacylase
MPDPEHRNVLRVVQAAAVQGLSIEVRHFREGTHTADDAARAIGCTIDQIVKSLVFLADGQPVVALVCGSDRVDTERLAAALGSGAVRRATVQEAHDATGFTIGGIPPFGHERGLPVLVDEGLLRHQVVWAAAGLPDAVFSIAPADLARVAKGRAVAIATGGPSAA